MVSTATPISAWLSRLARVRRSLIAFTATVALSAALAPAAIAGKPDRQPTPPTASEDDPPGVDCPTAIAPEGVRFERLGGNQAITVFANGRILLTGTHPDRVTNIATGKSVVLHLQGSASTVFNADGTAEARLSGSTSFTFFPGDVGPGDITTGRTYLFAGDAKLTGSADGAVIGFTSNGRTADVCAMIA